jgi:hypothetical protein
LSAFVAAIAPVVDDRREEVEREDERALVVEPVHGGVVRRREADEQVGVGELGHEPCHQVLEQRGRVLRGAAAAGDELGEPDFTCCGHGVPTL